MTYRTTRVLAVIAGQADLSNSEIARRAGTTDLGQASKLLARLSRLGLIENTRARRAKGSAKAWRLTSEGAELQRKIGLGPFYETR